MSTLVDFRITSYAFDYELIEPFNVAQVNPASYDVRLGSELLIESINGFSAIDISDHVYMLKPGEFALGVTMEYFKLPTNLEAVFQLKSSRGREGYEHALAGYIDPGYHGEITLELSNLNRFHELPLYEGLLIGQIRFLELSESPRKPYSMTGHYHKDKGVQKSKVNPYADWKSNNYYRKTQET